MADPALAILVVDLPHRLLQTIDNGQHRVLAFAHHHDAVEWTLLGHIAAEDGHRGAAQHNARARQQPAHHFHITEVVQPGAGIVDDYRQRIPGRAQPPERVGRELILHHYIQGVVFRMGTERLHVAPGERYDIRAQRAQTLAQYRLAPTRRNQRQVEDVLLDVRALLMDIVGHVYHTARIDLPARQAHIEHRLGSLSHVIQSRRNCCFPAGSVDCAASPRHPAQKYKG